MHKTLVCGNWYACIVVVLLLTDIGEATGMMADDVIATLASLDMISERDSRFVSLL